MQNNECVHQIEETGVNYYSFIMESIPSLIVNLLENSSKMNYLNQLFYDLEQNKANEMKVS